MLAVVVISSHGCGEQLREPAAAIGLREPDAVPAGLDELAVGLGETGAVVMLPSSLSLVPTSVTVAVGRRHHSVEETTRLSNETVDEIRVGMLVPSSLARASRSATCRRVNVMSSMGSEVAHSRKG